MDVIEAIRKRKSIRGFKPDPIPKEVLKEILDIAILAPSDMNVQPWEVTVVTGEVLDKIRQGNVEMVIAGAEPNSDIGGTPYEGVYRQRQVDIAKQLYQLMGIAREDAERRLEWWKWGFRFFDAPVALILSVDRSIHESRSLFDVGAFMQTICLAALNYGLGTCIEAQGVMYPDVVRKFAGIPASKRIVISIAIGYPDWEFPANKVESQREPVEGVTTWLGFK